MPVRAALVTLTLFIVAFLVEGVVAAADVALVTQKGRAFSLTALEIVRGGVVRFVNDDKFVHQIYVDSPAMSFESDEQPPGTSVSISFPHAGTFEVRCHIHPKMLLKVEAH
jgi:plastocyanin